MKPISIKLPHKLQPYRGVIGFVIILFISNIFWKYNVLGDDSDTVVSLWGLNISAPFTALTKHVAVITASILHFLGWNVCLNASNVIRQETGNSAQLIWACSGLKQAYIFFCILAFSRGPWLKKLWFIPLGLLAVYLFNILRITIIVASIDKHPDWFEFLHLYFFKYLFYAVIFGMWVFWEEKIANKKKESFEKEKKSIQ